MRRHRRIRVGIALEEALLNALYHGNLELTAEALREARSGMVSDGNNLIEQRRKQSPYRDRRIHFQVDVSTDEARFVVRDEGPGFNPSDVPDPTDPANLERESGRGLLLMRSFMDEVQYAPAAIRLRWLSVAIGKIGTSRPTCSNRTMLDFVPTLPFCNLSFTQMMPDGNASPGIIDFYNGFSGLRQCDFFVIWLLHCGLCLPWHKAPWRPLSVDKPSGNRTRS